MIKRRRLGTVYELSPAETVREWFIANIGRVMFTLVAWLIWLGVYYMILSVVKIMMAQGIETEANTVAHMIQTPLSKGVIGVGMILIAVYILRDPMKRKKGKRG
ncbi:MAG: hypothetical protein PHQ27_10760 [Victivallales bacterium]|nr:hypothetical protein [Victivallales bacterium]